MAAVADAPTGPKLESHAATAALYATKADKSSQSAATRFLDGNNKLSSAGAAASLKYANAKDLPSFPTSGLKDESAASAAATLGWKNQSSFEHWKPDPSSSASKAALMAKDYKAKPLWQPEQSSSGAKAAVLAAKDSTKVEVWKPEQSSWGNTAATQAFKSQGSTPPIPTVDYDRTAAGRHGSLLAATGAMSGRRQRSDSTPVPKHTYPDESNAALNALSAATYANKPSRKSKSELLSDVGASPYTNLPKEFYTSNPPVEVEKNEKDREAVLRASAVAMAQQMYKAQQKQIDQAAKAQREEGQKAANSAHRRQRANSGASEEVVPMRFNNLQEAAQKLAQERLAKLHDEHAQNREYRDYYGGSSPKPSKLSIRTRVLRRSSSDEELDDDKKRSEKIRAQMSLFSSNLSQVDSKKREADRAALMAAAQRNVTKSLQGMDEKVLADTGKVSQSMISDWEVKAHAAAQKKSEARMENHGKIDIGGGKFVDQSAIDEVARRNVQPILDQINEKAEAERARQAELKLEQEKVKKDAEQKKIRENETKEGNRKLKEQEKQEERAKKGEEKVKKEEARRALKEAAEEEKVKKEEARRALKEAAKEEKRKSKEASATQKAAAAEVPTSPVERETIPLRPEPPAVEEPDVTPIPPTVEPTAPREIRTATEIEQQDQAEEISPPHDVDEISPGKEMEHQDRAGETSHSQDVDEISPGKGVKGWLKTRFSRRLTKTQRPDTKDIEAKEPEPETPAMMAGGLAITGATNDHRSRSVSPHGKAHQEEKTVISDEEHDENDNIPRAGRSDQRPISVSTVSSESKPDLDLGQTSSPDEFEEARDDLNVGLSPPPAVRKSASPAREARFHEEI